MGFLQRNQIKALSLVLRFWVVPGLAGSGEGKGLRVLYPGTDRAVCVPTDDDVNKCVHHHSWLHSSPEPGGRRGRGAACHAAWGSEEGGRGPRGSTCKARKRRTRVQVHWLLWKPVRGIPACLAPAVQSGASQRAPLDDERGSAGRPRLPVKRDRRSGWGGGHRAPVGESQTRGRRLHSLRCVPPPVAPGSVSPARRSEPAPPPGPERRPNGQDARRAAGPQLAAGEPVTPLPAPRAPGRSGAGGSGRAPRGGAEWFSSRVGPRRPALEVLPFRKGHLHMHSAFPRPPPANCSAPVAMAALSAPGVRRGGCGLSSSVE